RFNEDRLQQAPLNSAGAAVHVVNLIWCQAHLLLSRHARRDRHGCPMTHILAIDQGTTSSRAIVFRRDCSVAAVVQREFPQHFPKSGGVEHDLEDIGRPVLAPSRAATAKAGLVARAIAAMGIASQRETTLVWDRAPGKPIHNAIVWQDRRTA